MVLASDVSARVAALIARHHGGDRHAAANHLGIEPDCLAGLLSGDWRRFSLDAFTALVCGYGVGVDWLLAAAASSAGGRAVGAARPAGTPRSAGARGARPPTVGGQRLSQDSDGGRPGGRP